MDEIQAIRKLKKGDLTGLGGLVELFQVEAYQIASFILGEPSEAEEIVQAAFLRVVDRIDTFDESRPFRPWFMRIIVNDALKTITRRSKSISLDNEDSEHYVTILQRLDSTTREPEDAIQRKELLDEMRNAIAQLPPGQRAALVMHYYLDLNTSDAAARLGCAPGTFRWYLSTARERLRGMLKSFR